MSDDAPRADIDTLLAPLAHGLLGLTIALSIFQGGASQDESAPALVLARDGFLLAALFLTCVRAGLRGRIALPPASVAIPLVGLIGAAWLSVGVAQDRYAALRAAWRWSALGIFACLAIPLGLRFRGARALLVLVLACAGVVLALAWKERLIDLPASRAAYRADPGIAEVDPIMREEFESRLFTNQVSGPFLLPNGLGALAAMAAMCAAGVVLGARTSERGRESESTTATVSRWLGGGLFVVAIGAGIFSNQKAPWLAMIGGAMIAAATMTRSRRWRATIVAGIATAAIAGVVIVAIVPNARWERIPGGLSIAVRREYAATAARMIALDPLRGIGAGNYGAREAELKEARDEEARFAHDDYLEAASEMGLVGGFALIAMWAAIIARGAAAIAHRQRGALAPESATEEAASQDEATSLREGVGGGSQASAIHRPSPPALRAGRPMQAIHESVRRFAPTDSRSRGEGPSGEDDASPGDPGGALLVGGFLGVAMVMLLGTRTTSPEIIGPCAVIVLAIAFALRSSIRAPSGAMAAGALAGAAAFALQSSIDFLHPERGLTTAAIALAAAVPGLCGSTGKPRDFTLRGPLRALPGIASFALFVLLASFALPRVAASDAAKEAARAAIGRGDASGAIAAEEEAIDAIPIDVDALVLHADTLAELARRASPADRARVRDAAVAAYEVACAGRSGLADVKSRAAALLEDPPAAPLRALSWLERAALAYPSSPRHRFDYGRALAAAGQMDRARAELFRALALDGDVRTPRLRLTDADRADAARLLREP